MQTNNQPLFLVSACLLGLCTRYDAQIKKNESCMQRLKNATWIPVCPEQLGGLPTPRDAADIINGDGHDVLTGNARVMTQTGQNVTPQFIAGAKQILTIASSQRVNAVFLKKGSPSCGVTSPCGVTAAILSQHGFNLEEF
jgi:uncharacterized protein YbbK (DUF523 family)